MQPIAQRFEGKSVLVTGGSSGIGLATAKRFVAEGATVFVTGRRQAHLEQAAIEIGDKAIAVQGDISKLEDLDRLFATIGSKVGRLDVVVANAGAATSFLPLGAYTEEHLDETFNLNVKGTAFTVQKALPLMPNGSSVVLIGSMTSVQGRATLGAYAASKAALRSFARTWSVDLKSKNIRVNVISPGSVPTPAYEPFGLTAESFANRIPSIPIGRLGTTDDIAGAVAFFASEDSAYITGTELFVDGGFTQV